MDDAQADDDEDHLEEDEVAGAGGEHHPHHAQDGRQGALKNRKGKIYFIFYFFRCYFRFIYQVIKEKNRYV